MYSTEIEVDGDILEIEQGDVYEIKETLDFGENKQLNPGDVITVASISRFPNGIHFEVTVDGDPGRIETIVQNAFENNLEYGYMIER